MFFSFFPPWYAPQFVVSTRVTSTEVVALARPGAKVRPTIFKSETQWCCDVFYKMVEKNIDVWLLLIAFKLHPVLIDDDSVERLCVVLQMQPWSENPPKSSSQPLTESSVAVNSGLPPPLLSRFDLVVVSLGQKRSATVKSVESSMAFAQCLGRINCLCMWCLRSPCRMVFEQNRSLSIPSKGSLLVQTVLLLKNLMINICLPLGASSILRGLLKAARPKNGSVDLTSFGHVWVQKAMSKNVWRCVQRLSQGVSDVDKANFIVESCVRGTQPAMWCTPGVCGRLWASCL